MTDAGIDPAHFASIILKLDGAATESPDNSDGDSSIDQYLSSHPESVERARRAQEFSKLHYHQSQ